MTLEHIDMLIAFAAIMGGVSLVITVLVQMAVAVLALRGRNLHRGLRTLLAQAAPEIRDEAGRIAEEILQHPLISDSALARADSFVMKLLPSSLEGPWNFIKSPLRCWRLASAIRVEELISILKKLTEGLPQAPEDFDRLTQTVGDALRALADRKVPPAQVESILNALAQILPETSSWQDRLTPGKAEWLQGVLVDLEHKLRLASALQRIESEATARTGEFLTELAQTKAAIGDLPKEDPMATLRKLVPQVAAKAELAGGELRRWFEGTMDRATQHFTVHTRLLTALFAIAVSLALQLDSVELLKRLSTDATLRAQLVASAESITRQADEILAESGSSQPPARLYLEAMKQFVATDTNRFRDFPEPTGFTNLAGATEWLKKQIQSNTNAAANLDPKQVDAWLTEYTELVPQAQLRAAADRLNSLVEQDFILKLVPQPYPASFSDFWKNVGQHLLGILVSAALLSLGAPFWFNVLKSLSNLRPVLAQKEQKERK